jgi:hypothetical protein
MEQPQEQIGRDVTQRHRDRETERERDGDKKGQKKHSPAPLSATEAGREQEASLDTGNAADTRDSGIRQIYFKHHTTPTATTRLG